MDALESFSYNQQASHFAKLPEYSIHCGTDYLAVKDVPEKLQQVQPLHKILDLGCGTGLATRYLKKYFPHATIIGADINAKMLEQASNADPDGTYIFLPTHNDQVQYSFLPNTFDAIICSFVLHENRDLPALENFIENVAAMLRPNGIFIGWDVDKNLFAGNWKSIDVIYPQHAAIQDGEQYKIRLYPSDAEVVGQYWSAQTIATIVKSNHFEDVLIQHPTIEESQEIAWKDELTLAPYYVLQAKKKVAGDI